MKNILTEAFKQLSEIDQNVFNADENGLNKLDAFVTDSDNESENVTVVIDPNAEDETDLQDSYIGKILCRCVVCQSDIMKDEEELHKDEDCPDVVNCGEECPMCQAIEGYKIIGRIAPYEEQATTVDESVDSNVDETRRQKQFYEPVDPKLYKKLRSLYKKDKNVANNLATDPSSLPSPLDEYAKSLMDAIYTEFKANCNGEFESHLESGTNMSAFLGDDGSYASWDYSDEVWQIKGALRDCATEDEFIDDMVWALRMLVKWNKDEDDDTLDEAKVNKKLTNIEKIARKTQKQINESVNPNLFKKLKKLSETDEDVAYNLAADPFSLPSPFGEYGESVLNAAYIKFQTDCNGELESSLESGTGMSEFRGEGVYARWDFDDEIEMIEEALSECDTEDEFIKSVVGGLFTLVDFNEQAEEELDEAAGNKKLTNIEKIAKKFPELNLLKESVDCVNVVSDGQEVEVKPEGDRTTITISPVEEAPVEASEEVVAPLDDEEKEEIDTMLDEPEDIEIDEFDEEQFDDLGESFLKKVYENVDSYKTTSGIINGDKLMLEGIITFKSGKQGKTNFVFESHSITKTGKLKFIGENLQFAKNKAFVLTGKADGKKLIAESLNYRYSIKDEEGKSHPLYGTVKK